MIISCEQCDVAFEAKTSARRFCSDPCRYKARVARNPVKCRECGESMPVNRDLRKDGTDVHGKCKKRIIRHGSRSGYDKGCRCDDCRSAAAACAREYAARRKARDGVSPTAQLKRDQKGYSEELMSCALCGERLGRVPANGQRGYHRECRKKMPSWLAQGKPGPRQRAIRARLERAARGRPSTKRVFTQGACNWCGEQFMSSGGSFFCSENCRMNHRHYNRGGLRFTISPIERQAIYERDDWMCQLCKRPVDRDALAGGIWSPTLDHVIPQSRMLVPDHSAENLRLSHLLCNSFRGDMDVSVEEMRLLTDERWSLVMAA